MFVPKNHGCQCQLAYVLKYGREISNSMHMRQEPMDGQVGFLQPLPDVLERVGSMNVAVANINNTLILT